MTTVKIDSLKTYQAFVGDAYVGVACRAYNADEAHRRFAAHPSLKGKEFTVRLSAATATVNLAAAGAKPKRTRTRRNVPA